MKEQRNNAAMDFIRRKDEIVQGVCWKNGKGCAVGCTVKSKYEETAQKLLREYDVEHIVFVMDEDIREEQHSRYDTYSDFESFLVEYCKRHAEKFDEDFYDCF